MNKAIYANNFIFDEPCDYKGVKLYPIKLKDYVFFNFTVDCLLIDKNSVPDAKVISMSYLDYLVVSTNDQNKNVEKLLSLIYLCTKIDMEKIRMGYNSSNHVELEIDGISINSNEFDDISKIICEQNMVDVPDYTIQKEIRDKIDEGRRIRSRMNNSKFASLEDQIVSLSISTGIPLEQIYDMTYRKFMKSITRMDLLIHYKIYLQSSMSGMVTFKDTSFIKHWLNELDTNNNSDMVEMDAMQKKISFEDKKK